MTVSNLWNALEAKNPLFYISSPAKPLVNDESIISFSITRGNDSPAAGVYQTTASFELFKEWQDILGSRITIGLTDYGASLISRLAGNVSAEKIKERFWGRTGIVKITDTPDFSTSKIDCSGWLSIIKKAKWNPDIKVGMRTGLALRASMSFTNLGDYFTPVVYGSFDAIYEVPEKRGTFENLSKIYGEDIGLHIREVIHQHEVQIRSIEYRISDAIEKSKVAPHLTRSAALSPAEHTQTTEDLSNKYIITTKDENGNEKNIQTKSMVDRTFINTVEIDLSYIRSTTEQIELFVKSLEHQTNKNRIMPESITVDLLLLLTSESEHERNQAGYLLTLEAGDPVFLSNDWQEYLRGVYFAQQIVETCTPDTWELKICLYPAEFIVGSPLKEAMPIPQTWQAAEGYKWNDSQYTKTSWKELGK